MCPGYGTANLLASTLCVFCVMGCATGRKLEILESRLTAHQDKLLESEQQLAEARTEIQSLQDKLVAVRRDAASQGRTVSVGPRPKALAFASLLTGGVDEDGQPGDEAVRAIIQPLSDDGGTIRSEGKLHVELLDVSAPSDRRTRGTWTFAGQELRDLWSAGLFSTGYKLRLAPEDGVLPDAALLIARFTTPEGDQFEAVHTVKLDPDESLALATTPSIIPVSAERESLSDHELSRDFPAELPVREPPRTTRGNASESGNPFVDFVKKPLRSSDVWTDKTIPVLR